MSEKPKDLDRQLVLLLEGARVDRVIDVGANQGQYAARLRRAGYGGPILSFEPQPEAHAALVRAASDDKAWEVAAPLALGASTGTAHLAVSAEDDMSSLRDQTAVLRRLSPSSAVQARIEVAMARLDRRLADEPGARLLVKLDVQGSEDAVLDGMAGLWPRVVAVQLELALTPLYHGEWRYLETCTRLESLGYRLALVLPGYFDGKVKRQLQIDGVFVRGA
ncbi:MAG: FkbM family methyltransferase [Geminicoccaceae bacterium]|nr:MAG: FkbM family methyltransferase [Geminicoccaceae bacterium]